jgi:hypothetical protein
MCRESVAELIDLLKKKKNGILERWLRLILETYPANTAGFLKQERDRFVNPVGATLSTETEVLYQELLQGMNSRKISSAIENIVRIRSVQDFAPSRAVLFVPLLKKAIQEELAGWMQAESVLREWLAFESRIDELSLRAFDLYTKCRDKIYEIRIREMKDQKDRAFKLMARSGMNVDEE